MFSNLFEALEDRRLMSVTAATLAGPLTKGASFTYEEIVNNKVVATKITYTVKGSTKFNGVTATDIQESYTVTSSGITQSFVSDRYENLTSTGLVLLGHSDTTTQKTTVKGVTQTTVRTSTVSESPARTISPGTWTVGKPYTYNVKETIVDVTTINGKQTSKTTGTRTITDVVTLATGTTALTIPAGKFSAYKITIQETAVNGAIVTKSPSTDYFANGVGLVESVAGTATLELVSYKV